MHMEDLGLPWLACVTEDDYEGQAICERYATDFTVAPNRPLGGKWNAVMDLARLHGWETVMVLGSDDLVLPWWVDSCFNDKIPNGVFLPSSFIARDVRSGQQLYVERMQTKMIQPLGMAGMVLDGMAVDLAEWPEQGHSGMDTSMLRGLKENGVDIDDTILFTLPCLIDLKGPGNIWSYETFERWRDKGRGIHRRVTTLHGLPEGLSGRVTDRLLSLVKE